MFMSAVSDGQTDWKDTFCPTQHDQGFVPILRFHFLMKNSFFLSFEDIEKK